MKNFLWIIFVSMLPIVELRGAIPIGCGMGLPAWQVFIAAVIGNLIPVPFIILFIRNVFRFVREKWSRLDRFVDRLEAKAMTKADKVRRYEILGLWLLVAIPLPGTGAWTGALIAALTDIRLRRAFPTIAVGVITAGVIVTAMSYGLRFGINTMT